MSPILKLNILLSRFKKPSSNESRLNTTVEGSRVNAIPTITFNITELKALFFLLNIARKIPPRDLKGTISTALKKSISVKDEKPPSILLPKVAYT